MAAFRPKCPTCGMAMITASKTVDVDGNDLRSFECLRCGHYDPQEKQDDRRIGRLAQSGSRRAMR